MLPTKEDIKTELKQSFTDDVIVALAAFANAKGGNVYVGMCDDGTACGVRLGKETIQIKIFPDRIEFYNPGLLPDEITINDLMTNNYRSLPRNKQIADIFKEMGEIEKYGSGIRRVMRMCIDYGLPAPEWKQNSGGIVVTVWKSDQVNDQVSGQVSGQVDNNKPSHNQDDASIHGQVSDQVSDQVIILLKALTGRMTIKEMLEVLGLKHHPSFRLRYLNPALKLGFISMTMPDSPNSPTQKYYLTDKGKQFLSDNKFSKYTIH